MELLEAKCKTLGIQCQVRSVSGTDHYYTDGASVNYTSWISFLKDREHLATIYLRVDPKREYFFVWPNNDVKKMLDEWILAS